MRRLSQLPLSEARAALLACCGSSRWAERMLSQRPFKDADEVFASATRIWNDLAPGDWHEAFRAHPRIGENRPVEEPMKDKVQESKKGKVEGSKGRKKEWSAQEQAGMNTADEAMRSAMAQANRDYEARFGWIYLVCATGRSAAEMLAFARQRMENAPDEELRIAAAEQDRITALRLQKLLEIGSQ